MKTGRALFICIDFRWPAYSIGIRAISFPASLLTERPYLNSANSITTTAFFCWEVVRREELEPGGFQLDTCHSSADKSIFSLRVNSFTVSLFLGISKAQIAWNSIKSYAFDLLFSRLTLYFDAPSDRVKRRYFVIWSNGSYHSAAFSSNLKLLRSLVFQNIKCNGS